MTPKTILLLLAPLFLCACKKDKSDPSILGRWELRTTYNGFTGGATHYAPGNGRITEFTATTYADYDSTGLLRSGTYQLVRDSAWGSLQTRIIKDFRDFGPWLLVTVDATKLSFTEYAADGGGSEFERLR